MFECNLEFLMYQKNFVPYRVASHTHTCYELVYYIDGSGSTEINGKVYEYKSNTFSIVEPKLYHGETASVDTNIIFIGFSVTNLPFQLKSGIYPDNTANDIYKILSTMKNEILGKEQFYNQRLHVLTQDILIIISRIAANRAINEKTKDDPLLNSINYLNLNFFKDVNLHTLADISGYSYDHFRHIFKQMTGFSPKQYIIEKRINLSKNLLAETDEKITSIAYKCFFASNSQFIKIFRKATGITPLQYRSQCKKHQINIKYTKS